jgi:hypothetical protein
MTKRSFRWLWLIIIVVWTGLACQGVNQAREAGGTAQAIVTQVKGFVTQNSGLVETAKAFATEEGPKLIETGKAVVTSNAPLVETAKAFATEEGSGLLETAKAVATDNPQWLETAKAAVTQIGQSSPDEKPEDIPVLPEDQMTDYFANRGMVSFSSSMGRQAVIDYYKGVMPVNGWTINAAGTVEAGDTAVLSYKKDVRTATIVISTAPTSTQTNVVITISQ